MMLPTVVEVADTVCDADCSKFFETVVHLPPPTADRNMACHSTSLEMGRSIDKLQHGSHSILRIKFPDFSITFPDPIWNFCPTVP